MTKFTQGTDAFTDADPGITFAAANDSWTILKDVLVSSARSRACSGLLPASRFSIKANGRLPPTAMEGHGTIVAIAPRCGNAPIEAYCKADGLQFVLGVTSDYYSSIRW
jgi:hypothetical protein